MRIKKKEEGWGEEVKRRKPTVMVTNLGGFVFFF